MFRATLEKIVTECKGGVGAVLMGYDGIAIEQWSIEKNPFDLTLVGIEYSNVTKEVRNAAEILKAGELQEVAIKTSRYYLIIHSLTDEYFAALIIQRDGNYGLGRYLLTREAPALRLALS